MRRILLCAAVAIVTPGLLALPVVSWPADGGPAPVPVTPTVTNAAIRGIDVDALLAAGPLPLLHTHERAAALTGGVSAASAAGVASPGGSVVALAAADTEVDRGVALPESVEGGLRSDGTEVDLEPAIMTAPIETPSANLVGVTWKGELQDGSRVLVRVYENGDWGDWTDLAFNGHGPDPGTAVARASGGRVGSEPLLVEDADLVQVRVDTPDGMAPREAEVTTVDSPEAPADAALDSVGSSSPLSTASAAVTRPTIISRAQWGADESKRNGTISYTAPIKVAFIHHTASSTNYSREQAAGQIRALYAWYVDGLNYNDIAYNFLVDRFGRLYEGRAGGMDQAVEGGHTAGFNANSFAVSALGNFEDAAASDFDAPAMVNSISKLIAWKFSVHGVNPYKQATLTSSTGIGTSKYPAGTKVTMDPIMLHGDYDGTGRYGIGSTLCPGAGLRYRITDIRTKVRAMVGNIGTGGTAPPLLSTLTVNAASLPVRSPQRFTFSGTASKSGQWVARLTSPCLSEPVRVFSGTVTKGGVIRVPWDLKLAGGGWAGAGTYSLRVTLTAGAETISQGRAVSVAGTAVTPPGPCAAAIRLAGADTDMIAMSTARVMFRGATEAVVVPAGAANLAHVLVAAPYSAKFRAPTFAAAPTGLSARVVNYLRTNKFTSVTLIGSSTMLPRAIVNQLRAAGLRIKRIQGNGIGPIALSVATAVGAPASGTAVYIDIRPSVLSHAIPAAASAAAAGEPVLPLNVGIEGDSVLPAATLRAVDQLGLTNSVVAATASRVPTPALAGLPGIRRIAGTSVADADFAFLARPGSRFPARDVVLLDPSPAGQARGVLAAQLGRAVLPIWETGVPPRVTNWLTDAVAVRRVFGFASVAIASDTQLAALSKLVTER